MLSGRCKQFARSGSEKEFIRLLLGDYKEFTSLVVGGYNNDGCLLTSDAEMVYIM